VGAEVKIEISYLAMGLYHWIWSSKHCRFLQWQYSVYNTHTNTHNIQMHMHSQLAGVGHMFELPH